MSPLDFFRDLVVGSPVEPGSNIVHVEKPVEPWAIRGMREIFLANA